VQSSASFIGKYAFFGSNDGKVYAVDTAKKSILWTYTTPGPVTATPLVADGFVIAGSSGGGIYALNQGDGKLSWSLSTASISQSGALAEGTRTKMSPPFMPMLYIATDVGTLYAVNRDTGDVVWTLATTGAGGAGPIVAYTKIYIGDNSGRFYEIGALKYATAAGTFTTAGVYTTSFPRSSTVMLTANSAWGKYGINQTWVSVFGPKDNVYLRNATMTFIPGRVGYNLAYNFSTSGLAAGSYTARVLIEDAHSKLGANVMRCCGWVNSNASFTLTP
jgi:outer membrane protein assembly factor BamB